MTFYWPSVIIAIQGFTLALRTVHFVYFILLEIKYIWRCHVVVYVAMGVVVVASGSSPSAYIRGLIRRIDRGDPNAEARFKDWPRCSEWSTHTVSSDRRQSRFGSEHLETFGSMHCWIQTLAVINTEPHTGNPLVPFICLIRIWGLKSLGPHIRKLDDTCIVVSARRGQTVPQTSPSFTCLSVQVFWKQCGKRRDCS